MAFGLAFRQRTVTGHIQRRAIGLFQDRHRFAHSLCLVDARGIDHQRSARRLVRQTIAGLAPDFDQERVDLLPIGFLLRVAHVRLSNGLSSRAALSQGARKVKHSRFPSVFASVSLLRKHQGRELNETHQRHGGRGKRSGQPRARSRDVG
ncbi:hypothetical protein RV134_250348 [Roseovarius sp. EC-HK134]|nr:hypothetical protein RV134_250348 [Roseovarius sp. EC-HK134]VVT08168.1 hypothetical protein RV420_290192 [Roseovarius sp. EC-SD190]